MMAAVRGKNTSPEILVRKAAHRMGLRFRLHDRRLPGRPDLVLPKWKTVVFVNGCFWHRHPGCKLTTSPKTNRAFWQKKFRDNTRRDASNYARLESMGWRVVVLWQCEASTIEQTSIVLARYFRRS